MERRHVIGGALVAGLTGATAAGAAGGGAAQNEATVADAIDRLHGLFGREFEAAGPGSLGGVGPVRQQQRAFLRANHKYPDFIEVGVDVWEGVYNWHIKHRQPITAARLADGRYALTFMFTRLLMRTDTAPDYVGLGFDGGAGQ
jgi:hypothetical protein